MGQPHKHAELIKAWADGADIQCRVNKSDWVDLIGITPSWFSEWEYRIKPKTIRYRNFIWKPYNHVILSSCTYEENQQESRCNWGGFIKWLGDWQEVEV